VAHGGQVPVDGCTCARVFGRRDFYAFLFLHLASSELLGGQGIARISYAVWRDFGEREAGEVCVPPSEVLFTHGLARCPCILHDGLAVPAHQLRKRFLAAGQVRMISILTDR
jgi:hypothetical protein